MTRNILREYRAVRPVDITAGKHWYSDAFFTAADLANETGFALEQCVGVIAALSPQQQWWQNVMLARQAVTAGVMIQGHTGDNIRKVNAILQGAEPLEVLGGLKVRSFYNNILSEGQDDGVTIDRHAWRTAMGRNELGTRNAVPTDRAYLACVDAYQHAATFIQDVTPAQLQAIVWIPRSAK
jgi:hypothetical protein